MSTNQPYRVALLASHPVQYQAPLLQQLAQQPTVDLTVYYGHDGSLTGAIDPGFGVPVTWDRPLLTGYSSIFLTQNIIGTRWQKLRAYLRLLSEFRARRYDAVIINEYANLLSWIGHLVAWLTRTPILLRTESELFRPRKWQVKLAKKLVLSMVFKATSAFLTIGTANRAFYSSYGVNSGKMFDTPYCVDNDYFLEQARQLKPRQAPLKANLGFPPELPIILFSGKLIERKRPLDLLKAYQKLIARGCQAGLLMVGEGELRGELEEFIRQHKLEYVVITGFKNQTELPEFYACGDIFVLPARFDTWGLVVNEAMLFGMPVIVTDMVGAGQDLVIPGVTGYTYPVGDISRLTELLCTLMQNPTLRSRLSHFARRRIENWNYMVCVEGVQKALSSIRKHH